MGEQRRVECLTEYARHRSEKGGVNVGALISHDIGFVAQNLGDRIQVLFAELNDLPPGMAPEALPPQVTFDLPADHCNNDRPHRIGPRPEEYDRPGQEIFLDQPALRDDRPVDVVLTQLRQSPSHSTLRL